MEQEQTKEFDIGSAIETIGAEIFAEAEETEGQQPAETTRATDDIDLKAEKAPKAADTPSEETVQPDQDEQQQAAVEQMAMPQSWKKDMAPVWEKMPAEAQKYYVEREQQMLRGLDTYKADAEYGRGFKDVVTPYMPIIEQQGLQPAQAVQYLLNAHAMLSNPQTAADAFVKMAERYGVDLTGMQEQIAQRQAAGPLPPEVRALQQQVQELSGVLTSQQRERYEQTKQATATEVETFASNPANPYFDECADHICQLLKANPQLPLKDAYDQAVWANPVTRAKELARIGKEQETAARKKAQEAAQQARRATSANIRGRDSVRAPTEPAGTMDETLRETLAEIHSRA